jgi:hypothetical protein
MCCSVVPWCTRHYALRTEDHVLCNLNWDLLPALANDILEGLFIAVLHPALCEPGTTALTASGRQLARAVQIDAEHLLIMALRDAITLNFRQDVIALAALLTSVSLHMPAGSSSLRSLFEHCKRVVPGTRDGGTVDWHKVAACRSQLGELIAKREGQRAATSAAASAPSPERTVPLVPAAALTVAIAVTPKRKRSAGGDDPAHASPTAADEVEAVESQEQDAAAGVQRERGWSVTDEEQEAQQYAHYLQAPVTRKPRQLQWTQAGDSSGNSKRSRRAQRD